MHPLLSDLMTRLATISDTPALDASVLIARVVDKPRTWVMAHPELTLTDAQQTQLQEALLQLENGRPFPYVLGCWEFFGMEFDITPDVLIPRPETELLVEKAIAWLNKHPARRNIADVGTGSGAIAVSIAVNVKDANILATDISPEALKVAQGNAAKHGVGGRIKFVGCSLLPDPSQNENARFKIDLLCANLPYIPTQTLRQLPIYGREPAIALDGGEDGFSLLCGLMRVAPQWVTPNGLILLEIEASLGRQVLDLAHDMFPHAALRLHKDLAGRDRLLEVQL